MSSMNSSTETKENKNSPRWKDYYQRNRDKIKAANLARYYSKAGRAPPPPKTPPPPIDDEAIKRLEALVAELRGLIPKAMKPPKKSRNAKAAAAVRAIVDQAHIAIAGCTSLPESPELGSPESGAKTEQN
jgi:hypothetical protein